MVWMGMDPVPGTLGDVLVDLSDPPPQATTLSVQATASAARVSFREEPEGWFCFWEVAARDRVSQAKEEGDVVLGMSVDHDEFKQAMQITYPAATHSRFWGGLIQITTKLDSCKCSPAALLRQVFARHGHAMYCS